MKSDIKNELGSLGGKYDGLQENFSAQEEELHYRNENSIVERHGDQGGESSESTLCYIPNAIEFIIEITKA
jgi:hypothetical protein